ncbi:hypothetical protein PROFUN_02878 [Planoprotostelium fungivorum]|uniref:B30.2/SPRY domain-containing protein n=1 Tax=Planoprotostelium fungivorum TaxID=1890364 RepID=A0A2P6NRY2_9EUKA|nr:hypothetical protein PROFUN_02878 [Planoprotostelium fungivorum]
MRGVLTPLLILLSIIVACESSTYIHPSTGTTTGGTTTTSGRGVRYGTGVPTCNTVCKIALASVFGSIIVCGILLVGLIFLCRRCFPVYPKAPKIQPEEQIPITPKLFTKKYPPQEYLPSSEHVQYIIRCGTPAWRFMPDPASWCVQRNTLVDETGRLVRFCGREDSMMQTNYPLFTPSVLPQGGSTASPPSQFYFEVTVLDHDPNTVMAVGLASKPYPSHLLPGWSSNSIGFHSDEGKKFFSGDNRNYYGSSWSTGDTLGVGYLPQEGTIYFTMNGRFLGNAETGIFHLLFPCIGADGPATFIINFGEQPYLYIQAAEYSPAGLTRELERQKMYLETILGDPCTERREENREHITITMPGDIDLTTTQ